jgi:hypothetical protein
MSLGFADPLALAFATLFGALVLFYLWERWRRPAVVPSLLLWEAVREDVLRARKFRPDLLFVLQALALACLIGGLARPYVRDSNTPPTSARHIFVLDTTASMQTREVRGTRFAQARAAALERLSRLSAAEEVMLITASSAPEVVVELTREHDRVAHALNAAEPTDVGGDLGLSLAFAQNVLQRSDLPALIEVFTDIPRSQLPAALREQVAVFQVGENDDNLGIESLQVFQGRFQDYRRASVQVQVRNYAHREGHGLLTVQLQDQVVHRAGFSIGARQTQVFRVDDFPAPGRVLARLEVDDALAADNTAYGWIRPLRPVRAAVVSPPSPLLDDLRNLAAATSGLQISFFAPDEALPAAIDLVIFHRTVPHTMPPANALFIYPPTDSELFPAAGDATNIEVIDWNARHPALQGLRPLAALPLHRARVLNPPEWSQVLLWSRTAERELPLALAGEHAGRRLACLTFDLEAERLLSSDNVSFLLFFLNVVSWLAPAANDAAVVHTGDAYMVADLPVRPIRVLDPRGVTTNLPEAQVALTPRLAGEYRISADGTTRSLLANFFDSSESDIGRASQEAPQFPATMQRAAAPVQVLPPDFGYWLYVAAAAFLAIEWTVARRVER